MRAVAEGFRPGHSMPRERRAKHPIDTRNQITGWNFTWMSPSAIAGVGTGEPIYMGCSPLLFQARRVLRTGHAFRMLRHVGSLWIGSHLNPSCTIGSRSILAGPLRRWTGYFARSRSITLPYCGGIGLWESARA